MPQPVEPTTAGRRRGGSAAVRDLGVVPDLHDAVATANANESVDAPTG
jgi:hypothetical protein